MSDASLMSMMQQLLAGGAAPNWEQVLGERAQTDPAVAAVLQMYNQQRTQTGQGSPGDDRLAHGRARLAQMRAELDELRRRNQRLAMALGACAACWGEDPECPECAGDGGPGCFELEPRQFRRWVAPALARRRHAPPEGGEARTERATPVTPEREGTS